MSIPKLSFADKDRAYVVFDREGMFITMMTTPEAAQRLVDCRKDGDNWYWEEWIRKPSAGPRQRNGRSDEANQNH